MSRTAIYRSFKADFVYSEDFLNEPIFLLTFEVNTIHEELVKIIQCLHGVLNHVLDAWPFVRLSAASKFVKLLF